MPRRCCCGEAIPGVVAVLISLAAAAPAAAAAAAAAAGPPAPLAFAARGERRAALLQPADALGLGPAAAGECGGGGGGLFDPAGRPRYEVSPEMLGNWTRDGHVRLPNLVTAEELEQNRQLLGLVRPIGPGGAPASAYSQTTARWATRVKTVWSKIPQVGRKSCALPSDLRSPACGCGFHLRSLAAPLPKSATPTTAGHTTSGANTSAPGSSLRLRGSGGWRR